MKKQLNIYIDEQTINRLDKIIAKIKNNTDKDWSRGEVITTLVAIYGSEIEDILSFKK